MSGGHYDYAFSRVRTMADEIRPFTPLRKAFVDHLRQVAEVMRAVEWADSGDISDEEANDAMRSLVHPSSELNAAYELALQAHDHLGAAIRAAAGMGAE